MDRLFEVFQAHNIRYFFYAGGNDSQDTADKIHREAVQRGYEMRVIGVPKTIDNDLPHTDHCPGYGSVAKYNACTVMEIAADVGSMATDDGSCCIIEVMGRSRGLDRRRHRPGQARAATTRRTSFCCRKFRSTRRHSWRKVKETVAGASAIASSWWAKG